MAAENSIAAQSQAAFTQLEKQFWADLREKQRREDVLRASQFEDEKRMIHLRIDNARRERERLKRKIHQMDQAINEESLRLENLDAEYIQKLSSLTYERDQFCQDMQKQFLENRTKGLLDPNFVKALHRLPLVAAPPQNDSQQFAYTGAQIWTGDDKQLLEDIRRIPQTNHSIEILLDLPVKRHVNTRPFYRLTPAYIDAIYDGKSTKWRACMIQATGEVEKTACHGCQSGDGPFDGCVTVVGDFFPKCANCEWDQAPCGVKEMNKGGSPARSESDLEMDMGDEYSTPLPRNPPRVRASRSARKSNRKTPDSRKVSGDQMSASPSTANEPPQELNEEEARLLMAPSIELRHDGLVYTYPECMEGVPVEKINRNHPYWEEGWKDPAEVTAALLEVYIQKHEAALQKPCHTQNESNHKFIQGRQVRRGKAILEFLETGDFNPYQLLSKKYVLPGLITYDTLFRLVNTIEELEKFQVGIKPSDWLRQRLHELIREQGDSFRLLDVIKTFYHDPKLTALRKLRGFGNIGRPSGHKRKRGSGRDGPTKKPLVFLNVGDQPASAKPKDEEGKERKEGQTQEQKQAVGQIPHPEQRSGQQADPPPQMRNGAETSRVPIVTTDGPALSTGTPTQPGPGPSTKGGTPVKPRTTALAGSSVSVPEPDPLSYDGFTDGDSACGDEVFADDYRVLQLKTSVWMTSAGTTQYWHLAEEGDFEHQVLKSINPPVWTQFERPINFNVAIDEILEILHHPGGLKVKITMQVDKEDDPATPSEVLAEFKRDRTKRRFLSLCRDRGRRLTLASSPAVLEDIWAGMRSQMLGEM